LPGLALLDGGAKIKIDKTTEGNLLVAGLRAVHATSSTFLINDLKRL